MFSKIKKTGLCYLVIILDRSGRLLFEISYIHVWYRYVQPIHGKYRFCYETSETIKCNGFKFYILEMKWLQQSDDIFVAW